MKKELIIFLLLSLSVCAYTQYKQTEQIAIPDITLNNGVKMPILGFGTLDLKDSVGVTSVAQAISVGYRLFDTAKIYGNEEAVGKGIKKSGIKREELFVSTKIWVSDMGYENTKKALGESLRKLGLEYIDLYLIHRPRGDVQGTWKAMEELYESGKIKAIGVSNFSPEQLADLLKYAKIKPVVNQIEVSPFFQQYKDQEAIEKLGIQVEAWSPFGQGRNGLFTNPVLTVIAKKHNKTVAQVVLRWIIQRGIVAIPRTDDKAYMVENIHIFDFELDASDIQQINGLDTNTTQFPEWN